MVTYAVNVPSLGLKSAIRSVSLLINSIPDDTSLGDSDSGQRKCVLGFSDKL